MLFLPETAKAGQQVQILSFNERLPHFLRSPCQLTVTYQAEGKDDYYLIHLDVTGKLIIECQRCMHEFNFNYENHTTIAVCRSDERAEQLFELYECIVAVNWKIDLEELIIDELHLYVPEFHPQINDCNNEILQFLT